MFTAFHEFATFKPELSDSILPPQASNPSVSGVNAANRFWKVSFLSNETIF